MFIESLNLKNWRNHSDSSFTLRKINIIQGSNGSGKSSIVDVIDLFLTNNLEHRLDYYVKDRESKFYIDGKFDSLIGKLDYSISYENSTSRVLKTSEYEVYNSDCPKILQTFINPHLAAYSCISKQGKTDSIFEEGSVGRLNKIKSIFSIDTLSQIAFKIKNDIKPLKEEVKSLNAEIKNLESKNYTYMEEEDLPDIEEYKKRYAFLLEQQKIKKENDDRETEYQISNSIYLSRKEKIAETEKLIDELNSEKEKLLSENFQSVSQEQVTALKSKIEKESKLKSEYERKIELYNDYITAKNKLENEIEFSKSELENLEVVLFVDNFDYSNGSRLDMELISLEMEVRNIQKKIQLSRDGFCSECGQTYEADISRLESQLNDFNESINRVRSEVDKFKKDKFEFEKQKALYEKFIVKKEKIESKISFYKQQLSELKIVERVVRKSFNIEGLKTELKNLETKLDKATYVKLELKSIDNKIESYKMLLNELILSKPVPTILQDHQFDAKEFDECVRVINSYDKSLSYNERIKKHNDLLKKEEVSDKEEIDLKKSKINTLEYDIKILEETFRVFDREFPSFMIEKATKHIQIKMNDFFQRCYRGRYEVYFKQNEKQDGVDFFYSISDGGHPKPAAISSGFERQLLSMAFRIALGSITDIGLYVFDEIDSFSDPENSIVLFDNFLSKEKYDQVIIISQKPETIEFIMNNFNDVNLITLN